MLITFLIAALASVALASGVPTSPPQNPCDCKAECESLGGWRYCYVEGGASCELAWRSWIHPGEAYVPCPAAEPTNDGISRPERSLLQFNDDDDEEEEEKQDCEGDFGDFGECQMKAGKLQKCRVFKIETPAAGDGKECKKNDGDEECESEGCEVDCEGDFGDFGECEMRDGKLQKCRVFQVQTPAAGDGKECKNQDGDEECESEGCEVDCEGDFGDFGECEMRDGKLQKCRVFQIETPAAGGGKECKNEDGDEECESEGCDDGEVERSIVEANVVANVDCEGDFGEWGECQMKDGMMQRCRTYNVLIPAEGGVECERDAGEEECESEGCGIGELEQSVADANVVANVECEEYWGEWRECVVKDGMMQRCRTFAASFRAEGGIQCEPDAGEEECISEGCEEVILDLSQEPIVDEENKRPDLSDEDEKKRQYLEAMSGETLGGLELVGSDAKDEMFTVEGNSYKASSVQGTAFDGASAADLSSASSFIDAVCRPIGQAVDTLCDQTISWPEFPKITYDTLKTNKCCTWGCGQVLGIPCTGCSASRCGVLEQKFPTGVKFEWNPKSICDLPLLNTVLGTLDDAAELCPCLLQVLEFIEAAGGDPSNIDGALVSVAADVLACAVTNGPGTYTTNYDQVVSGLGADAILGAPIDMSMYIELAASIATLGATLKGTAQSYVTETMTAMTTGIKDWLFRKALEPLKPIIETFQTNFESVKNLPNAFQAEAENCLSSLQNDLNGVSADMEDLSKGIEELFGEIEDLSKETKEKDDQKSTVERQDNSDDASKEIEDLSKEIEDLSKETKEKEDLSEERKKLFGEKDAEKTLIGKLTEATQELKKLVEGIAQILDTDISQALESITNLGTCFQTAFESLDGFDGGLMGAILDPGAAASTIKSLVDGEVASCIQDLRTISTLPEVVQQIQSFPGTITSLNGLVDDLKSGFDDKCGGVPRMIQSLGNLNAVGSTLEQALMSLGDIDIDVSAIQPDVASWQHSIKLGTIDLPCYEGMDTWGFDVSVPEPIGDVGISVDYPKFSRCSQDVEVPLPNGHIPYLKIVEA